MRPSISARIAYLNTQYPSLSHTFIEREVRALREAGVDIHTFSVRRPMANDTLGPDHQRAAQETFYLFTGLGDLLAQLLLAFLNPLKSFRAFLACQRLSAPGVKSRLRHFVYALEAIKLARELKRRDIRHIHVHMANNGAAVGFLASNFDRNLTYSLTIHGSSEFYDVHGQALSNKVQHARFVRCISNFCKAQVMTWTAVEHWPKLHVIHCGIDPEAFPPRPPLHDGPLRMLVVARFDPIKGIPVLFESCRLLSQQNIKWTLEIVGDGPLASELQAHAMILGIAPHITFSGPVGQDAIQQYYNRADVLVVSSFMEGVPVVLLEAMAKQLAVVATHVGGIPELVADGQHGLLVPPASAQALADALITLATNRPMLAQFGPAARERISKEYDDQLVAGELHALFQRYDVLNHAAAQMQAVTGAPDVDVSEEPAPT